MYGLSVAVLRFLDEKHHQKSDYRGSGIDHELPSIAVTNSGPEAPQMIMVSKARVKLMGCPAASAINVESRKPGERLFHVDLLSTIIKQALTTAPAEAVYA